MSVVGTRSKFVKYVIFTFILRCYYDAARFSLRLTRSYNVLTTRSSRAHQVQQVLIAFSLRQGRSHHALTTSSLRPSSPYCGRQWPVAYIMFIQNSHQIRVWPGSGYFYTLPKNERGYQISWVDLQREAKLSVNL